MNKIDSSSKSVRELLDGIKYTIEPYQREYKWETKQIADLLEDLEERFLSNFDESHERKRVKQYSHYFLGSVLINHEDGTNFVIDGQQRLTSLTLLLIYLNHLQRESENGQVPLDGMIFSEDYGEKSFNFGFDLEERRRCMETLYNGRHFDPSDEVESVRNIVSRYADIEHLFPDTLKGSVLPYFIDWLRGNVDLVQITTYSDDDAYGIFETMNDRGLGLSPSDMLKGYIISNIHDSIEKDEANELWKRGVFGLSEISKEEESDFLKNWLRAKYAKSIRSGRKGEKNQDFEKIGSQFHRWVRERKESHIGLKSDADFLEFVRVKFSRFSGYYRTARNAAQKLTPGLQYIFYNAHNDFTLQNLPLLAPLRVEDDKETVLRKLRLVSGYLDIYIARRIVNSRVLSYNTQTRPMFNLAKDIRDLSVCELSEVLKQRLAAMEETFDAVSRFSMNQRNRWKVHYLLARITHHIENESGVASSFENYVSRQIKKPFEVEHIWADKYERHTEEFDSEDAFHQYRNRFGGLLLLPRGFNQSYGSMPYKDKVNKYIEQNLLVKSLNPQCYINNPAFLSYKDQSGLPFRAHPKTFLKKDLDERQELYRQICEEIWDPARLDSEGT